MTPASQASRGPVGSTERQRPVTRKRCGFAALGVLATLSLPAFLPGQALPGRAAGSLRFTGTGVLGANMELGFEGVATGGSTAFLVLSPRLGEVSIGGYESRCFSLGSGFYFEAVALDPNQRFALPFALPRDRSLVGFYLAAQVFRDNGSGIDFSNCASFLVASDLARTARTETFDTAAFRAPEVGPGDWADSVAGALRPARVGGVGTLGSFDYTLGTLRDGAYVFRTDAQSFPAAVTLLGAPVTVTDGRFDFVDFVIPRGVTVRFEGPHPARILVSGLARIDGVLDVSAVDLDQPTGTGTETEGQPGGTPGPGGGAGGAGGDTPAVAGGSLDGGAGTDLGVASTSPHRAAAVGTAGAGSAATPDDPSKVTYTFFGRFSNQMAAGGGGGGFVGAGLPGRVIAERNPGGDAGPPGAGGKELVVLPKLPANTSREQFLIGGSGGGGGGTHVYDAVQGRPIVWVPGSGGGGGGGALLFAVGGDCTISTTGRIHADGGSAASRTEVDGLLRAPGGGGSGGTVLLQVGGSFRNNGVITALGGIGGVTEDLRATPGTRVAGGKGAPGLIRVESNRSVSIRDLGQMDPPASLAVLGDLVDREAQTLAASRWYRLPVGANPAFLGYEIYGVFDANTVIYSDRRGFGSGPVRQGRTPVTIYTRMARLDASGQPIAGSLTNWFEGAAPALAGNDAVQVLFFFDTDILGATKDLRLETLRLTF